MMGMDRQGRHVCRDKDPKQAEPWSVERARERAKAWYEKWAPRIVDIYTFDPDFSRKVQADLALEFAAFVDAEVKWLDQRLAQMQQSLYEAQNPMLPNGEAITISDMYTRWQDAEKRLGKVREWASKWKAYGTDALREILGPDDPTACSCGREASEAVGDPLQDHEPSCTVYLKAQVARVQELADTWADNPNEMPITWASKQLRTALAPERCSICHGPMHDGDCR